MKNRLRRHEKEAIHNRYKDELLYKLLYAPTKAFEREMKHFALSTDEVYMEVIDILDHLKADKQEARNYARSLWNTYYCDYRDLAESQVSDEEITLATSVVLYGVVVCLNVSALNTYTSLSAIILSQLTDPSNRVDIPHLSDTYNQTIFRSNTQLLLDTFVEYMKSDRNISHEIDTLLIELPQIIVEDKAINTDTVDRITNRQLILLFLELMNIPLDSSTNISAFSKFLSYVSGRSAGGIRDIINRNEVDYDSERTKEDLAVLSKKIQSFAPEIAAKIKNV